MEFSALNRTDDHRIREVDFLRGIALILMIIFHAVFDLREFYDYPVQYGAGIYFYIGKVSVILFILVSAVSCSFSRHNPGRALKLLAAAFLITVVSHLYDPQYGIKFGILHFLGTGILLYPLVRKLNMYSLLILGTLIILMGQYLGGVTVKHNYLFLFNLTDNSWVSADYYPLAPWLGVFLYGIALGKLLYPQKRSLCGLGPHNDMISFIGRHTLKVYLVHQPLLLLAIGAYEKLK